MQSFLFLTFNRFILSVSVPVRGVGCNGIDIDAEISITVVSVPVRGVGCNC